MVEDKPQDKLTITKNIDLMLYARGAFLEHVTKTEEFVSDCIRYHFCETDDKANEFFELFLGDRMTFGRKVDILKTIIKNNHPNMLRDEPHILEKLEGLNEFRNKLAHGMGVGKERDIRNEGEGYFDLVTFRNGKRKIEQITVEKLIEKEKDAIYVQKTLLKLWIGMILDEKYKDYDW